MSDLGGVVTPKEIDAAFGRWIDSYYQVAPNRAQVATWDRELLKAAFTAGTEVVWWSMAWDENRQTPLAPREDTPE